jgi:hypothetical protein
MRYQISPARASHRAFFAFVLCVAAPCLPAAGPADVPAPLPEADWRARTEADVAAIDRWVRAVYPAWVDPEAKAFRPGWRTAVARARSEAARTRDVHGWRATVDGLSNSVGDLHMGMVETAPPARVHWAGIAVEALTDPRAADGLLRVRAVDASTLQDAVDRRVHLDDRWLGCDGRRPFDIMRRWLHPWSSNLDVPGESVRAAPSVFVDIGNPFSERPKRCRFVGPDGRVRDIDLRWREVDAMALREALRPARRLREPSDEIGLRFLEDGGAWIVIADFGRETPHTALRAAVAAERERILSAPYLVFDLRGNSGGNSLLADALAESLWGVGSVVAAPPLGDKLWRTGPEVEAAVESLRSSVAAWPDPPAQVLAAIDAMLPRLRAAAARGEVFLHEPDAPPSGSGSARPPAHRSPVYLLTDRGCVSSCILAADMLIRMGAVHAGDPTGRQTQYMEAWFQRALPSGAGQFVLPIAVMRFPSEQLGGGCAGASLARAQRR